MFKIVLLTGPTGSGKTHLLRQLGILGEQVIDLEKLCNHRGSVFGGFNLPTQPTRAELESLLLNALNSFDQKRPVFVEQKGPSVGRLKMPKWFDRLLDNKKVIFLNTALSLRIEQIMETYQYETNQQLREALNKIYTRLSSETLDWANRALDDDRRSDFIREMLAYYDSQISYLAYYQDWDYCLTIDTKEQLGEALNELVQLAYL